MDVQTRAHDPSYEMKLRELLKACRLVLARSQSLQNALLALGCPPEKLRMNRTGIPLDQFPKTARAFPQDGAWRFVQACRLIEKKGLDDALHAFAPFSARHPKATFTIAGEGPLLEPLEKLSAELGMASKVTFTGFIKGSALCDLYHQSHVFVHPSRMTADQNQEGIPNSMLEAMATGLPVVATLHGGIPEAVRPDVTGFLVAERDRAALLQSMERLAGDAALWQRMGETASEDMRQNFESKTQIARLEDAYDAARNAARG